MTGRSHLFVGTATAVGTTALVVHDVASAAVVISPALATARLPDEDITIVRHRTVVLTALACAVAVLAYANAWHAAVGAAVAFVIVFGLRHRGATHAGIACLAVAGLAAFLFGLDSRTAMYAQFAAIGVLAGYGSHLAADACTPDGIPFFWPFWRRKVHLLPGPLRIPYDSRAERVVVFALIAGAIFLTLRAYA
jgi:inner membrane protein